MFQKKIINRAVVSVVAASALSAHSALTQAQMLEEVIVTATKKSESMQDVAIAVQAMSGQALREQNVTNFEDYVAQLPSVNMGGRGPGQNEVYIRGAAVDAINITVAESQGSAPNVAMYLDEQPITAGGRNLDVYISDMERIEVLPGPQGTLYGASSQAGTVRLITNKPNVAEFEGNVSAEYSQTAKGEDSSKVEAMINIPLIDNKLAIRGAFYSDNRGGYIDNVEGTFQANPAINPTFPGDSVTYAAGTVFANGTTVGAGGLTVPVIREVASNSSMVEDDFNDVSYAGARLGVKYFINDDWSALAQFTTQTLKTDGVFDYDPEKGDLNVSRFTEDSLEDSFDQFAWTIEGRLGELDVIYTGAYLDREVHAKLDYTGYTNIGKYIAGYQCEYLVGTYYHGLSNGYTTAYSLDPTLGGNPDVIECGSPTNNVKIDNEQTRFTSELRLSGDITDRARFLVGGYYEDSEILHVGNFNYGAPAVAGDWSPIDIDLNPNLDNADANARGLITSATQFRNDNTRTEEQIALFGEVAFDITEQLNLAVSARYYDLEYGFTGYGAFRYGNRPLFVDDADPTNDIYPNRTGGRDYAVQLGNIQPLNTDDTITKATLSYRLNDDVLFYVTMSEGYRPGGFNRGAAAAAPYNAGANNVTDSGIQCGSDVAIDSNALTGFEGYCLPYIFESDTLENLEFGWKATLNDGLLRFNGTIYQIDWKDIQVSQFDSQNISIFTLIDNGGDAEINGVEVDFAWAMTENFTLYGAASFNDTELTSVDPGFAIVVQDEGNPLPLTPEFQGNLRGRYVWTMENGLDAFWQLSGKYADEALNSIVDTPEEPNTYQDSYAIFNASAGVSSADGWGAELYVSNLSDERAELHINRQDFIERTTTNRPRTIGLRVKYEF
ncbi:MAG: TonB-dependent receptor [Aequoribacter sp.]|uniref:TonB-dependent receptor n=1 Tax=Aequoribacter sp. TaxID=2847771 RepID=UPI003C589875